MSSPSDRGSGEHAGGIELDAICRLVDLTEDEILAFVKEGLINPTHSGASTFFSYSDLLLLKRAKELSQDLALGTVRRAMRELAEHLRGEDANAHARRLTTDQERLVVHEAGGAWLPGTGQLVFPVAPGARAPETRTPSPPRLTIVPLPDRETAESAIARTVPARPPDEATRAEATEAVSAPRTSAEPEDVAEDWFRTGCELEPDDPAEAEAAYARALAVDPGHADAHINLGRLLHEGQRHREAERHYRFALAKRPTDATASFNLAVLLEDQGRKQDALAAYISTLEIDPNYADAHYNLARLHERMGHRQHALRHYQIYRELSET